MAHAVDGLRRRLFVTAASGAALALGGWSPTAGSATRKVVCGQGSIDPFFSAGYVGIAQGLFDGLDVECLNSQSGPRTNQLLAAGQIMFGATAATAAPAITLAGKPAKLIFGFDRKLTYANVIVRRADKDAGTITALKDLAGKRAAERHRLCFDWRRAGRICGVHDWHGLPDDHRAGDIERD